MDDVSTERAAKRAPKESNRPGTDPTMLLTPLLMDAVCDESGMVAAVARRPATPQTMPDASRGRSRRSRVIGIRWSSFEPRRRAEPSS